MGLFKKPKPPPPTAQERELETRQRSELDELTREENERLKSIKRAARGRRSLLGSGGFSGIRGAGGNQSGGVRGSTGGGSTTRSAARNTGGILRRGRGGRGDLVNQR